MAELPSATVTIDDEAGAFAGGTGYAIVMGCVEENDDITPRVFSSAKSLLDQHGYSPAVDYCAQHFKDTKKPVIFVGLPKATAGSLRYEDSTSVTGTCKVSIAAGGNGYLDELDGVVTVVTGGTVGTDQITFNLSLDGGRTEKLIRLGTATSYTIPYVGAVLSFGSGGTLVAEDVYRFNVAPPMWAQADMASAKDALAAQLKLARSWLICGDVTSSTVAGYVTTEINAYETENDRFAYARVQVKDRYLAKKSKVKKRMSGAPSLTFAEVGGTGDTITRATGSWVTDGFVIGDVITVSGTADNNFTDAVVTNVSASVLTLDTQDLVAEVTSAATVVGSESLTFAEVGATGDTITRSTGSWTADGFAVGDTVVITGTASNNITAVIANLSATVMTLGAEDLAAEVIAGWRVTVTKSQSMAAYVAAMDSAFASVDGEKRMDLALGRARVLSPITGWYMRRPAAWAAALREYSHDVQIPCWRKADGPLSGWSLEDENGNVVEFDERTNGGGLAGRFTCLRTYGNGPRGSFVALSLTRATEGSLLSRTHNMAVANVACTIAHAETENAIGQVLVLKDDGKATEESLQKIEGRVNSALEVGLLQQLAEGQRASKAVWSASRDNILNVPGAELTGSLELVLNGTLEKITTRVVVRTAG